MKNIEIASIRFGQVSFRFYMDKDVENFLETNEISPQKLIPTASSWYNQVLQGVNLSHEKEKKINVIFISDKTLEETNRYLFVSQSPLRFKGSEGNNQEKKIKFIVQKIN